VEELIAAIHSLESAVRSLDSFWIAIANLALPLTLSIIVVIQNYRQNKRNIQFQNDQFKKDVILRRYESIFEIYLSFTKIGRYEQENDIFIALKEGNDALAIKHAFELNSHYNSEVTYFDLAKLLFGSTDDKLISVLELICKKHSDICDEYTDYIKYFLMDARKNAWGKVCLIYKDIPEGDLEMLRSNKDAYDMFLQLMSSKALSDVEAHFKECWTMVSYQNYDAYFSKYLRIAEICNQHSEASR
jgi:hypothetical protein